MTISGYADTIEGNTMLSAETINAYADDIDIAKVLSEGSDASGCYRDVYFINDDIVMKVDISDCFYNEVEYYNYRNAVTFDNTLVIQDGVKFKVRFPEMAIVGKYIFAERIHHPHIECGAGNCIVNGGDVSCGGDCDIVRAVDVWCQSNLDLYDIHSGNFCWDAANETAWIIDFGA